MQNLKVATHSGSFHADDVMAIAIISELAGDFELVRTRDQAVIDACDLAVDVGGEYDPARGRFDHHQKNGAGCRSTGKCIPYAGCGLVWKELGAELCGSQELADVVDYCLISAIDAQDVGLGSGEGFSFSSAISQFNPTWEEGQTDEDYLRAFWEAVAFARATLKRVIASKGGTLNAREKVLKAKQLHSGKVLLLEEFLPWQSVVAKSMPACLYVVFPSSSRGWMVQAVQGKEQFSKRKELPHKWGGLPEDQLVVETGVADAMFCHTGLFICGAYSKEGALKMAELAVKR